MVVSTLSTIEKTFPTVNITEIIKKLDVFAAALV